MQQLLLRGTEWNCKGEKKVNLLEEIMSVREKVSLLHHHVLLSEETPLKIMLRFDCLILQESKRKRQLHKNHINIFIHSLFVNQKSDLDVNFADLDCLNNLRKTRG
ncbi:unnamed protein product [Caretta caretta]